MNHWKIVKSIWQKVEAKNPQGTLSAHLTTSPVSQYTVRMCITRRFVTTCSEGASEAKRDPKNFYKIVSMNFNTMIRQDKAGGIHFLNFNTDVERYNAWQSYLTKFARFCICMDESTKLAPYMDDYTQPWDDQRFYAYFGLTQPEIQLIETVIK